MSKTRNHRSPALLMALYTFLLALGAVLPLAASYSEDIKSQNAETHIRSGAYQRRVQVMANASDSVGLETPTRAVELDGIDAAPEPELHEGPECSNASMVDSRGS